MAMDLAWLQQILVSRKFDEGAALTIADRNGVILARYPEPEHFVGTRIPDAYQYLVREKTPGSIELTSQDGTRRILAYFPAAEVPKGLYISTGVSVESSFAFIPRATVYSMSATVFAILISLLLAWQTNRYAIQRPVNRILAALAAWRRSDTASRTGMSSNGDELSTIGAAIDRFLDQLKRLHAATHPRVQPLLRLSRGYLSWAEGGARTYAKVFGGLERRGISVVIPTKAEPIRSPVPMRRFRDDAKNDILKCPRGKTLRPTRPVKHGRFFYSKAVDCRGCALSRLCLSKGRANKAVVVGNDYPALLRARRRREKWTEEDRRLYQRHRSRSEGFHGEAKSWHGLARAVRRGLSNMKIQGYLTAAAINLKRLAAAHLRLFFLMTTPQATICELRNTFSRFLLLPAFINVRGAA